MEYGKIPWILHKLQQNTLSLCVCVSLSQSQSLPVLSISKLQNPISSNSTQCNGYMSARQCQYLFPRRDERYCETDVSGEKHGETKSGCSVHDVTLTFHSSKNTAPCFYYCYKGNSLKHHPRNFSSFHMIFISGWRLYGLLRLKPASIGF